MSEISWLVISIITIASVILAGYAQIKVSTTYSKYSKLFLNTEISAGDYARSLLSYAGLNEISIISVKGTMSDYYNHRKKVLALSDDVMNGTSIASYGIMAHEVGHALQYQNGYFPIKIRNFLIPIANFASKPVWPMLIIGVFLDVLFFTTGYSQIIIFSALALMSLSLLVNLVTLPVEFDASRRAIALLKESGKLNEVELEGAKSVLSAAAMTYIASFILSLINMIRIIFYFTRRD